MKKMKKETKKGKKARSRDNEQDRNHEKEKY